MMIILPWDKYDFERVDKLTRKNAIWCKFGYKKCVSPGLEERIFLMLQLSQLVRSFIVHRRNQMERNLHVKI